ncbi:MAG: cyclic nucleotide-binding domain-containing protein [Lentisphaeria bacterium]|nr:cyclic nucleotide-binding domain-containing protein [Lentisphaeria bacterium]
MTINTGDEIVKLLESLGVPFLKLNPNHVLIEEGDSSNDVYILKTGQLQVTQNFSDIVTLDTPGTAVGEVSALLGSLRSASVKTLVTSELFVIEDFNKTLSTSPELSLLTLKAMAENLLERDRQQQGVYIGLKKLRERHSI